MFGVGMSIVTTCGGKRTKWTRYVAKVADLMELKDWRIYFDDELPEDEAEGSCATAYGRKIARIQVNHTLDPEKVRHAIVHELVHCHTDPATVLVQRDLEELLEERVDRAFWVGFRRAFEYSVDGIATALAKHVPLPPA